MTLEAPEDRPESSQSDSRAVDAPMEQADQESTQRAAAHDALRLAALELVIAYGDGAAHRGRYCPTWCPQWQRMVAALDAFPLSIPTPKEPR